jgi:hypothetical protein
MPLLFREFNSKGSCEKGAKKLMRKRRYKRILVLHYLKNVRGYLLCWKYKKKNSKERPIFLGRKREAVKLAEKLIKYGFAEELIEK